MNPKYKAALILLVVLIIILVSEYYLELASNSEFFASKDEKVDTLVSWFKNVSNPTYSKFRRDMKNRSNIVEYEDLYKLLQKKNLTVETAKNVLNH